MLSPDGKWLWNGQQWMALGGRSDADLGAGSLMLASHWRRLAAFAVDLGAYMVVSVPLWFVVFLVEVTVLTPDESKHLSDHDAAVLFGALGGATLLCIWVYETVTSASQLGGTFGKRLFGMRAVTMTGAPLSVYRSLIRAIAKTLSLAAVGEGLVWLPFTPNRQHLHDFLPYSVVVVQPFAPAAPPLHR